MKTVLLNKIIYAIVFWGILVLPACKKKEYIYTLSDEQLVRVLADLHIAEAKVKDINLSVRDSFSLLYYQQVLKIHELEASMLEEDLEELKRNPKKLEEIYEKIEKFLTKKRKNGSG